MEYWTLNRPGKHSFTELYPQPPYLQCFFVLFWILALGIEPGVSYMLSICSTSLVLGLSLKDLEHMTRLLPRESESVYIPACSL
jgi:hypothetical protein